MKTEKSSLATTKPITKKIPLIYLIIIQIVLIALFAWVHQGIINKKTGQNKENTNTVSQENSGPDQMKQVSGQDSKFVKPLRLADVGESGQLKGLKQDIAQLIEMKKKVGQLTAASVYYRKLRDGSWLSINGENKFKPGSISKIPILIYYLKLAEADRALLDKEIMYSRPIKDPKNETYRESTIKNGESYKIRELLSEMIVHSDNIATTLLLMQMDKPEQYRKIFLDLSIPVPGPYDAGYCITASDCSKFLRVLYNSSYLNERSSEFAMDLLSKASFSDGIRKRIPPKVKLAHKFGEAGAVDEPEFSETGIVYDGDNPYLITIMTKGTDVKQQAEAISEISKLVFDKVSHTE